jgi:hypothetical protein
MVMYATLFRCLYKGMYVDNFLRTFFVYFPFLEMDIRFCVEVFVYMDMFEIDDYIVLDEVYTRHDYPYMGDDYSTRMIKSSDTSDYVNAQKFYEMKREKIWNKIMKDPSPDEDYEFLLLCYESRMKRGLKVVYDGGHDQYDDRRTYIFQFRSTVEES